MSFDAKLVARVRSELSRHEGIDERRMFGGVAFFHRGNMLCGVQEDRLVLRLGREGTAAALARAHVRPMDFTGRVLRTMVFVDAAGLLRAAALRAWIREALRFSATLPAGALPPASRRRGPSSAARGPRRE